MDTLAIVLALLTIATAANLKGTVGNTLGEVMAVTTFYAALATGIYVAVTT